MPTRTKDYPIYTYDEPAVNSSFTGGINSDPSNDHLLETELRDCVNMTYLSGALVKRKGGKKLCDITCEDNLHTIQGIFLFSNRITYIIIAADGKLYQGIYNKDATINLHRLQIVRTRLNQGFFFDEEDSFAGIEESTPAQRVGITNHEGYIQTFFKNLNTGEEFEKNERGSYFDVANNSGISVGDVFVDTTYLYERKFLCIKSFTKEFEYPTDLNYWELTDDDGNEVTIDEVTYYADSITSQQFDPEKKLFRFNIQDLRQWKTNDVVLFEGRFYRCIFPHYNRYYSIYDPSLFFELTSNNTTSFVENSYLLFQNYRKVEAATIDNKLYIATGTRIIEVYLDTNELKARPVKPYLCNYTEITKIGYNYMSPYPELAVASQEDTVTTSISAIKVRKTIGGRYLLTPVMNIQKGDSLSNYYFRWEKFVDGTWYVIVPFSSQKPNLPGIDNVINLEKQDYSSLEVGDADQYIYRCTFAKSFELEPTAVDNWDIENDYTKGQYVSVGAHVYRCLRSHTHDGVAYINNEFSLEAYERFVDENENVTYSDSRITLWDEVFDIEMLPHMYSIVDNGELQNVYDTICDFKVNEVDGEYFGSATSVLFNNDLGINDNFLLIHSCNKIIADGNKLLFYGDRYNSGQWFKTIINNPGYVTDRGCLSFKTNKNESVIKVIPFQGNLIVFANADEVGGSIHLVQGNGDDYDDESGYYSPYQRRTINASISCSNADSIQICDNIIVFKYFNRVYYINASDLSNDAVKVVPCNDRLLNDEGEVKIPWDDDECISEVTDSYYALLWKEKYIIDSDGELVLEHPGIRVKMFYKMAVEYEDKTYGMPWLRDESKLFNTQHIIYVKGKPLYLYNNILVSFEDNYYKDVEDEFECKIHFKAIDLNYDAFLKLIENITVGFHRNQFNKIDLDVIIKNESGHVILNSKSKKFAFNDLGALRVGSKLTKDESARIGTTIMDHKMFITVNKFPCLFADTTVYAKTSGSFTLSRLTYTYTSIDAPDTNPSDLYANIIRPKEEA